MALSFLYSKPELTRPGRDGDAWVFFGGDFKTYFVSGDKEHFTSKQIFKAGSPHTGAGRGSTATPPYHWHKLQNETFDVKAGTLAYCVDGKEGILEAGQKLTSPAGQKHTFWNASKDTDLEVHITVRGGDNPGFDENFVHNFYGYLSSQTMAGRAPNVFQMLLFMYSADVVLVDVPFGKVANYVLGYLIGQKLLGLSSSYKEFEEHDE